VAVALVSAAAAAASSTIPPRGTFSIIFLVVILASAWWGGYGPGIFAALLSLGAAPFVIIPGFSASHINYTLMVLLLLVSLLVSRVASGRNEREAILRDLNESLDERVRRRTEELERANLWLHERESLLLLQAGELARSNADLQQFAYVASHDLQEPLRLIGIYAELLKRRYGDRLDSEADRFLGVIGDGVQRMENLIRDLLAYSRVIHAEQPPVQTMVSVAEALKVATSNLELVIRESGAEIHTGDLPSVTCDRLELTQVLQNLISNAIKYRGPETPRIEINASHVDRDWVISVKDNGIGIPAQYLETIFSPFKRLHGQNYPGTGIGLALCRRIVERRGGKIWVESEVGMGATFRFSIVDGVEQRLARAAASEVSGSLSDR